MREENRAERLLTGYPEREERMLLTGRLARLGPISDVKRRMGATEHGNDVIILMQELGSRPPPPTRH
jgi:hypothetical protein